MNLIIYSEFSNKNSEWLLINKVGAQLLLLLTYLHGRSVYWKCRDTYMDVSGRVMQERMDAGGRATSGTVAEEQLPSIFQCLTLYEHPRF